MSFQFTLLDTSVFDELLNVPNWAHQHASIFDEFEKRMGNGERFVIPVATIIETGNHIAHTKKGDLTYKCAQDFVNYVRNSLNNVEPFLYLPFLDKESIVKWLDEYPLNAKKGMPIADLSIINDLKRLHSQFPDSTITIWTLDKNHLTAQKHMGGN